MRRAGVWAMAAVAVFVTMPSPVCYGNELQAMTQSKYPIKVFINEFSNESGGAQVQIAPAEFMKEVEKAFANRRSVSFAIVKTPQESDVEVSAAIKSYQYMEKDPVKPSLSFIMALDAATSENYAEMVVEFTVKDTKSGNVAWKDTITSYVKRNMTPAESVPVVYDRSARDFVAKAFGKGE
jgi:hypothetical protein